MGVSASAAKIRQDSIMLFEWLMTGNAKEPAPFSALDAMEVMQQALLYIGDTVMVGASTNFCQNLVDAIVEATNFDGAAVSIYDSEEKTYNVLATANFNPEWKMEVDHPASTLRGPLLEAILNEGKRTKTYSDFDADHASDDIASRSGFKGAMFFPIQVDYGTWGLICLFTKDCVEWNESCANWAKMICRNCELLLRGWVAIWKAEQDARREVESFKRALRSDIMSAIDKCDSPRRDERSMNLSLTPREKDVLALVAFGLSNQEIASRLSISVSTAKKHVRSLLEKTGAANRTQLASFARETNFDLSRFFCDKQNSGSMSEGLR